MSFLEILSVILYVIYLLLAFYAAANIIYRKLDPVKSLSWVVVIFALPYIGLFLYTFLGQNFRKIKIYNRKGVRDERVRRLISNAQLKSFISEPSTLPEELKGFRKLIFLNLQGNKSVLGLNKKVEIYFSGREALDAMYNSINEAKSHIHLQSYIIEDDTVGNMFKELLISKAKSGVEVRLIYDDVGCWSLKKTFLLPMQEAGIELLKFAPVRIMTPTSKVNYRNHRKILVVDGLYGFIGGVNIADRYYNGGNFPEWRDTHIKITGESVSAMQSSFLLDRYFIINRQFNKRKRYFPINPSKNIRIEGDYHIYSQIITSGPDSDWASIMQCYLSAITSAKRHIYIITPYFTPNETILNAIKVASLSGVEVNLMLPEKSDSKVAYWSSMSYATELLDAGVKVYLFRKGFNHSKVISIDGEFCIIGSANLDNRSLEHNFEITSIIYNSNCAQIVENQFRKDIERCRSLAGSKWAKRSVGKQIKEGLARLLSPLL